MKELRVHHKRRPTRTLVDDADYDELAKHRWILSGHGYAVTFLPGVGRRGRGVKGAGRYETLHRLLLELQPGDGLVIDHINGDKLDNQRANLHVGTQSENLQNRPYGYGRSRYRGVGWDESRQKWIASAKLPGMRSSKFLGRFDDEEEAARVVAAYRAEHMPHSQEGRAANAS